MERTYPEIVRLESDLMAAEKWPYPTNLNQALEAGAGLYSSKLVVAPGKNKVEVSDPGLERDPVPGGGGRRNAKGPGLNPAPHEI